MSRNTVIIIAVVIIIAIIAGSVAYYYSMMSHPSATMTSSSSTTSTSMASSSTTSASGGSTTKTLTFVGVGKGVDPYWSILATGMYVAGQQINQKYGSQGIHVNVIFWTNPTETSPAQIQQFETFVSEGVNGIAVAPADPASMSPYINQAIAKGIPVITFDTDAPNSSRLAYLGTNNYLAGWQDGLALYALAKEQGIIKPGATVKVLIETGSLAALNLLQRIQGAEDALKTAAKYDPQIQGNVTFQFIGPYVDNGNPATAVSLAVSALEANPDIKIAIGVSAYEGPAFEKAYSQLGIKPGQILTAEFDMTNVTAPVLLDGYAYMSVVQSQYLMGYYAVWLLFNMTMMGWQKALQQFIPGYPQNTIYYTPTFVVGQKSENLTVYVGPNNVTTVQIIGIRDYAKIAQEEQIPLYLLGLQQFASNTTTSSAQVLLPLFIWKAPSLQWYIFSILSFLPILIRSTEDKLTKKWI